MAKTYIIGRTLWLLFISCAIGGFMLPTSGCDNTPAPVYSELDRQLEAQLAAVSGVEGKSYFTFPKEGFWEGLPADPNNPISSERAELGKYLFHETALSTNPKNQISKGTYSCATCHSAQAGFRSGLPQAIGEGGIGYGAHGEGRYKGPLYAKEMLDVQSIAAPSVLNLAYQRNATWSGRLGAGGANEGLEVQWSKDSLAKSNLLGLEGIETYALAGMDYHRMGIDTVLIEKTNYKALYDKAFSGIPYKERYTKRSTALAISAYVRTLLSHNAPFQQWLDGDYEAMGDAEKRGAILFFGKAGCANCHNGPALGSDGFHALGFADLSAGVLVDPQSKLHLGRGGFTGLEVDKYKFRVPQLYNLANAGYLGHGGSFANTREVVEYLNRAQAQNPKVPQSKLSPLFKPLSLSETEMDDLVMFLDKSLFDKTLYNKYVPKSLPSGNCTPNNDPLSKRDLGCL
jgi:cytochrome c peroxidase